MILSQNAQNGRLHSVRKIEKFLELVNRNWRPRGTVKVICNSVLKKESESGILLYFKSLSIVSHLLIKSPMC